MSKSLAQLPQTLTQSDSDGLQQKCRRTSTLACNPLGSPLSLAASNSGWKEDKRINRLEDKCVFSSSLFLLTCVTFAPDDSYGITSDTLLLRAIISDSRRLVVGLVG